MNEVYQVLIEDKKEIIALSNSGKYLVGDNIIVKTSRGEQYGKITDIISEKNNEINDIYIIRKANKKDYNNYLKNISYSIDYNDSYSIKKNETTNINKILNEVDIYQKNILSFLKISSSFNSLPVATSILYATLFVIP